MKLTFIFFISLLSSLSSQAQSYRVKCESKVFSFYINKDSIGSILVQGTLLEQIQMKKNSVKAPEFENLEALYKGTTSLDSYALYVFKEKEEGSHISFLEVESHLGRKKVTELRCKL